MRVHAVPCMSTGNNDKQNESVLYELCLLNAAEIQIWKHCWICTAGFVE